MTILFVHWKTVHMRANTKYFATRERWWWVCQHSCCGHAVRVQAYRASESQAGEGEEDEESSEVSVSCRSSRARASTTVKSNHHGLLCFALKKNLSLLILCCLKKPGNVGPF